MVKEKILLVDDDENVLSGYRRQFRKHFPLSTARNAQAGLELIQKEGPFAVIVSDLRMPAMDGIEFLAQARSRVPDSVRMMLTGHAEVQSAVDAVNEGAIFRFLTKPCPPAKLAAALAAGIKQYRLITAEKELLEKTLHGAVKILTDALSLFNPQALGKGNRITRLVREMVRELGWEWAWEYETAAMLSQTGWITISPLVLDKVARGGRLSAEEKKLVESYPALGAELINNIPRLEKVARIVAYQHKGFDGSGTPADMVAGKEIPQGATLLKVALDFDDLLSQGESKGRAIRIMKRRQGLYDPDVLVTLETILGIEARYETRVITVRELATGMILNENIVTLDDHRLLLTRGQQMDHTLIKYVRNYNHTAGVKEPIQVVVPLQDRI